MGKRSSFKRRNNDLYRTPIDPVILLKPHLPKYFKYAEPACGDGRLIRHIASIRPHAKCVFASDINYHEYYKAQKIDATKYNWDRLKDIDFFLTNPPWTRVLMHQFIDRLRHKGVWLLFDADWMHTKQAKPYLKYCSKIVAVGRVKWIEGSKHTGKDNACWYYFGPDECKTQFYGLS